MINKILKELDRMIEIQQRSADRAEQMSNDVATYLEYKELAAYLKVQDMIKKCAQEAATSEGTQMDINSLSPEKYNTDSGKSEIRRLMHEILDICLCRMEDENGFIKEAMEDEPQIVFRFDGRISRVTVDVDIDDETALYRTVYLDGTLIDKYATIKLLKDTENRISKVLEMRKVDDLKEGK